MHLTNETALRKELLLLEAKTLPVILLHSPTHLNTATISWLKHLKTRFSLWQTAQFMMKELMLYVVLCINAVYAISHANTSNTNTNTYTIPKYY